MPLSVVLAGGGTAGHIEPALALADALRRRDPALHITALGTENGLETQLVPARGYELELIPRVPVPRRPSGELASLPRRLSGAVRATAEVLDRVAADVVVGFGGYVAAPAYLAARRRHVPIVVHESNAKAGLANRLGARFAAAVALATPQIKLRHGQHVGMPLRRAISQLDRAGERQAARVSFGLDPELPTLFVTGGSQGARRINEAAVEAAPALLDHGVQVLHHTGRKNLDDVRSALAALLGESVEQAAHHPGYVTVPYIEQMHLAYAAADLVVCRGGAGTVAELTTVGLPAVYVPLPHGNGEQRLNALPVVRAGGGVVLEDGDLTGDLLRGITLPLLRDPGRLTRMSTAAAKFGRRDADELLADIVLRVAGVPAAPDPEAFL